MKERGGGGEEEGVGSPALPAALHRGSMQQPKGHSPPPAAVLLTSSRPIWRCLSAGRGARVAAREEALQVSCSSERGATQHSGRSMCGWRGALTRMRTSARGTFAPLTWVVVADRRQQQLLGVLCTPRRGAARCRAVRTAPACRLCRQPACKAHWAACMSRTMACPWLGPPSLSLQPPCPGPHRCWESAPACARQLLGGGSVANRGGEARQ